MIELQIPVKPFVLHWLINRYGEKYRVSKKNLIGILLLELLNKKVIKPDHDQPKGYNYYIEIPELYVNTKGFNIDAKKIKLLGRCLDRLFYEDFYNFVDNELIKGGLSAYQAVSLFLEINNITEREAKLESMYRSYQRYSGENIRVKKDIFSKKIARK